MVTAVTTYLIILVQLNKSAKNEFIMSTANRNMTVFESPSNRIVS